MIEEMETGRKAILTLVDAYQNLKRIKNTNKRDEEIESQLKYLKIKLEICGGDFGILD